MKEIEIEFRNSIDKELKELLFDKKSNLTTVGVLFMVSLAITFIQYYLKKIGGTKKNANN